MTASDITAQNTGWREAGGLPETVLRYSASACGPVAVSAAHFLASLIFLHTVPAVQFGLFSFVMVTMSLGMSLNMSLICVPITRELATGTTRTRPACFQMNWLVCAGFGVALLAALLVSNAPPREAALLALFGASFTFRWFARCLAFVDGRMGAAIRSDLAYSVLLTGSLGVLAVCDRMTFTLGSEMLLLSALAALLPFGTDFFRAQLAALRGAPGRYWPIFRDVTRWSVMGATFTELTVNAHAYLVTFISGPAAFALLALGMLLMRPASLLQSALPDLERPAMARAIAAGDRRGLSRTMRHFTFGLTAAWTANVLLCAALLAFFPGLVLKGNFSLRDLILVAAVCGLIMAIRALRTPLAVLLQAAGQFKDLAMLGAISATASLTATLGLLLAFGPIASLGGIVVGELVVLERCYTASRRWKQARSESGS